MDNSITKLTKSVEQGLPEVVLGLNQIQMPKDKPKTEEKTEREKALEEFVRAFKDVQRLDPKMSLEEMERIADNWIKAMDRMKKLEGNRNRPLLGVYGAHREPPPSALPDAPESMAKMKIQFGRTEIDQDKLSSAQDKLAKSIAESNKDTWKNLPKDLQDRILELQKGVIEGNLEKVGEATKGLKPERLEEMCRLVEKSLRDEGAKLHVKSVGDKLLLYPDNAKHAVIVERIDGRLIDAVVAIDANEPNGPPALRHGAPRLFRSADGLASDFASQAVNEIAEKGKTASKNKPAEKEK